MSVREKIVGAFEAKNLAWHAEFERAIDHLTAVGMSDALGSALFRAKYCNDRHAGQRPLHLLTHKAAQRLRVEISYARSLATAALREWLIDSISLAWAVFLIALASLSQTSWLSLFTPNNSFSQKYSCLSMSLLSACLAIDRL